MLRQASSRNQRYKGFKVKHFLQISLLIAVCIWLLYQVKHSHEKRRALEERNIKSLNNASGNDQADFVKLGRKDLPHIEETGTLHEIHNNEEESEETQEEEEQETNQQEIEDEERRDKGDDDDIDEQDQGKDDEETEQDQEESMEEEDKNSHDEDKDSRDEFENQDHEGGTQEAREENYKRDDASSAVVHDTQTTEFDQVVDKADDDPGVNDSNGDNDTNADGSKHDNSTSSDGSEGELIGENLEKKAVEAENMTNNAEDLSAGGSVNNVSNAILKDNEPMLTGNLFSNVTSTDDNLSSNVTSADIKNMEFESKPDNGSVTNPVPLEYNNQTDQQSTMVTELQANSTGLVTDNFIVDNAVHSTVSTNSTEDQNSTIDGDSRSLESLPGELAEKSNTTAAATTNISTNERGDAAQGESNDSLHAVVTEEEKDAVTDLSTLPDIQNVLKSTDVEAAEQ